MSQPNSSAPQKNTSPLGTSAPQDKKLLDQYRDVLRIKHYSPRTEDTYILWVKNYILFHNKRHPKEMGIPEIGQYLTYLATKQVVAASTQNPCTELVEVKPSAPSSSSTVTYLTSNSPNSNSPNFAPTLQNCSNRPLQR